MRTVIQQAHATIGSPLLFHARMIPIISAAPPARGEMVACTIAGNVITASVTYGT